MWVLACGSHDCCCETGCSGIDHWFEFTCYNGSKVSCSFPQQERVDDKGSGVNSSDCD